MSFLIKIYKYLYRNYWITSKPKLFFNQPAKKIDCQYKTSIWATHTFDQRERQLISEALTDFLYFCNGCVEIDIVYDIDPNDEDFIKNNNVLVKSHSNSDVIKEFTRKGVLTTGLCTYREKSRAIYLACDLLINPLIFKCTLIHELGHFISLGHVDKTSLMQELSCEEALFLNYKDAQEMAKVWSLDYNQLRFLKDS